VTPNASVADIGPFPLGLIKVTLPVSELKSRLKPSPPCVVGLALAGRGATSESISESITVSERTNQMDLRLLRLWAMAILLNARIDLIIK